MVKKVTNKIAVKKTAKNVIKKEEPKSSKKIKHPKYAEDIEYIATEAYEGSSKKALGLLCKNHSKIITKAVINNVFEIILCVIRKSIFISFLNK